MRNKWSKDLIIKKLKNHHSQGVQMTSRNIQRTDTSLYNACFGHFGSLSNAMKEAGIFYNDKTPNKISFSGGSKIIEITHRNGKSATVIVDYDLELPSSIWISCGYPVVKVNGKDTKLHAYVYGDVTDGCVIDHIDRNVMNAKRSNLREITRAQNNKNRTSNGYSFKDGLYQARIMTDGVSKSLGYFESKREAKIAYLQAKLDIHGVDCSPMTLVELKEIINEGE